MDSRNKINIISSLIEYYNPIILSPIIDIRVIGKLHVRVGKRATATDPSRKKGCGATGKKGMACLGPFYCLGPIHSFGNYRVVSTVQFETQYVFP